MEQKALELDKLVAERVMGLDVVVKIGPFTGLPYPWHSDEIKGAIPHYSTDIAAAWEVVTAILETWNDKRYDPSFSMECKGQGEDWQFWTAGFGATWTGPEFSGWEYSTPEAPTAPRAICLAALKVKGIEIE